MLFLSGDAEPVEGLGHRLTARAAKASAAYAHEISEDLFFATDSFCDLGTDLTSGYVPAFRQSVTRTRNTGSETAPPIGGRHRETPSRENTVPENFDFRARNVPLSTRRIGELGETTPRRFDFRLPNPTLTGVDDQLQSNRNQPRNTSPTTRERDVIDSTPRRVRQSLRSRTIVQHLYL
ncbi:PREDICTED: uncharacterized protein LOC106811668 [Priapulus caudatus]|uniref:Uncharacterized protein LOC106811668 n=1 Tax=Priapulus caudatus TaxID=37621 RepID=A0ABM1EF84_PRICU|nr:PREDICTED: uncharacterized protein LOC106811668 [Priapulus caudatus]